MDDAPPGSPQEWEAVITAFLQDHVRRAGAGGVLIGMSGGIDSAVAGALAVGALGADHVVALLLPAEDSDPQDEVDGRLVCDHLGLEPVRRPIAAIVAGLRETMGDDDVLPNAKPRARMMVLYAEAQRRGHLVLGTGNKSELLVGYFTKFGDGGVDLAPLGDLYKTQVWELARHLGLPPAIIEKPPSAGLRAGQTDERDLGLPYQDLDRILKGIELNRPSDSIAERTGLPLEVVARVSAMVRGSEHKRHPPLIPKIGARTVGIDWRRPVHWDA